MSSLRSALEELAAEELAACDDGELAESLRELERAAGALRAERARRVAEIARRRSYEREGYLSATPYLRDLLGISASRAARYLRWARALARMPRTAGALACGGISGSAAEVLIAAAEAHPEPFARCEDLLVRLAGELPIRDLARAVAHFSALADADAPERAAERRFASRRLHVSPTLDGMVRIDGDLDPETGQVVLAALRAEVDAQVRAPEDRRTPAQRRADALAEICRSYLDRADRAEVGGERPHLLVNVDLAVLTRSGIGRAELPDVGAISPEEARRIACDAGVSRVITAGPSQVLDLGRRTPVVSPALRRALVVRDDGCAFPGCGRPPGWCDAHHVVHWADGGPTALSNLVLLCRPHHRMVHHGFRIRMDRGRPVFHRPNGTRIAWRTGAGSADRGPP
ncbi:MAG: HNH endonuclease [Actinomycetota bacterium]|nr:MAG: HNH endonuclease [Actinomycetota bacterium]